MWQTVMPMPPSIWHLRLPDKHVNGYGKFCRMEACGQSSSGFSEMSGETALSETRSEREIWSVYIWVSFTERHVESETMHFDFVRQFNLF
jgi:hypothetical protein